LLEGFGGILAQSATDAGQLITREAVEPPTILECFAIFFPLYPLELSV
jgi:hypothetical protein